MDKTMQTAYQRWEMTSFGDERPSVAAKQAPPSPPPPPEPAIPLPTAEELEAIRAAAHAEGYDEGYDEGRAAGHAAGHADGVNEGQAQARAELAHLQAIAATFGAAVSNADEAISGDVLDLALHLARAMLRTALDVKPELVIPVVREAIEYLPSLQQPALLVLHPQDAEIVRNGIGEELDKGGWRVVPDPTVARGGCKVDTATNQIDAQVGARWQRLAHSLGKNLDWLA
jgi:flagellar assembly protein FliH